MTGSAVKAAPANFRRGARPTWHQRRRHAAVQRLAEGLSGDALDYGCGWGDIAHLLKPQFSSIIGLDVSPNRVAFASEEYAPIPFEVCEKEGLRFADGSFDVVLSVVVLPFVPDPDRYLPECVRVLRPNGSLVLVVPNPESNLNLIYGAVGKKYVRSRHLTTQAALLEQLGRFGFHPETTTTFYDPPFDRLTNPVELTLALMNVVGHLTRNHKRASYLGYRLRSASTP